MKGYPKTITEGSARVKVYFTPVKSAGKTYDAFTVRYYAEGKKQQKKFGDAKDADEFAKATAESISAGQIAAWQFSTADKEIYTRAERLLTPIGKAVDVAAIEYAEMHKLLDGIPPLEAARYYALKHPSKFIRKTLKEVVDEMSSAKKQDGLSKDWIRSLNVRCGKLVAKFGANKPIIELNGVEVDAWIRTLKIASKTRANYKGAIQALESFAKSRKYLPPDFAESSYISTGKEEKDEIEIYTPEELQKLLRASRGSLFLFIAFGAFAGLRSSEIARLDWSRVRDDGIEVFGKHPRTPKRRIAPMLPELAKILKPHRKDSGKVWNAKKENPGDKALAYLNKRSSVKWKHNALRHSFISYRLAIVKHTAQVALECGTSEAKIFSNYRQLVTEQAAREWFAICDNL